jgi:purine-binding chemotaxis protein CheW
VTDLGTSMRGTRHPSIDWAEIRRRLQSTRVALEQARSPGDEHKKATLRERARALARELKAPEPPHDAIEVMEFVLAREHYAFESVFVREVHPLKALTPVPCTPPHIVGIVNVRGQIVSVLDIRRLFDLPPQGLPDLNKLIVLRSGSAEFGILADDIVGTRTVFASELQTLPAVINIRSEYVRGIASDWLVILDAGKLLSDEKLVVDEEVGPLLKKGDKK